MRIAISGIAWRPDEDSAVRDLLESRGVNAIEAAPSKIGPKPAELTNAELARYRAFWAAANIEIVAMQALLFGRTDLALFGSDSQRDELFEYLSRIVRVGGLLGAKALVFGSPGNRKRSPVDLDRALELAAPFFRRVGTVAVEAHTCLCIEPNPPEYGCDWITNVAQARALVDFVAHPGFGLHLDAGAIHMAGEDESAIHANAGRIRHFHVSEPQLAAVRSGTAVPHARYAAALRAVGGVPVVSIEMRQVETESSNLPHLERALDFVAATYG